VGCTRAVAKIASGLAKPNKALPVDDGRHLGSGVVLVPAGRELEYLGSLPLRRFPGIGPVAEQRLLDLGLHTIEQLLSLAPGAVLREVEDTRERIRAAFDGETPDLGRDRPAFQEHDPVGSTVGSISNECTFSANLSDRVAVEQQLLALVERVCWRARRRGVRGRTVSLKLRYADFDTIERSRTGRPSADDIEVFHTAKALLRRAWSRRTSIRLLGVGLSNLVGPEPQLELPFPKEGPVASSAIDVVRERFGYGAIRRGRGDG
jgi:DNA polymerase-4